MVLSGKQKAALLLMNLDPVTAGELLKGVAPSAVQDLAVELSYLEASGHCNINTTTETAIEFCESLGTSSSSHVKDFLNELLKTAVGNEKAKEIQSQIDSLIKKRDPFMQIRSASVETLVPILKEQHPQVVASVLSELTPKKSSDVLNMLSDELRSQSISRMAVKDMITPEAKTRIAEMICKRLESSGTEETIVAEPGSDQSYRKIAVIMRNLTKEIRDGILSSIGQKDPDAPRTINKLMVLWEDLPLISDRSLQGGLRGVDSQKMGLAITDTDEAIVNKIKSNISERAAATLEEEMSLMADPKKDDITEAREEILRSLRKMNEDGELSFVEE